RHTRSKRDWSSDVCSSDLLVNVNYYPFDFVITIILIAILLFKLYMKLSHSHAKQAIALQKADKRKNEFLQNTTHELRNPIQGITDRKSTRLNSSHVSISYA